MIVNVYGYAPIIAESLVAYTSSDTSPVTKITAVADVSGSLNNKYFFLVTANCDTIFCVWMNVNSAGTVPIIPNVTFVEIPVATNATDLTVGAALRTQIALLADYGTAGAGAVCDATDVGDGDAPLAHDDPDVSGTSTGFTFAATASGSNAVPADLFYKIVGKIMVERMAHDMSSSGTYKNIRFASEDITLIVPVYRILDITEN